MKRFEGKTAVITGSTRGIGRAAAELFASEGAKTVIVGMNEELGMQVTDEIQANGGEAFFQKTDVTSGTDLDALVQAAADQYGKIDILINNAGIGGSLANMDQITDEEWDQVLATNLTAPFQLMKRVIPMMEKAGGGTIAMGRGTASNSVLQLLGLGDTSKDITMNIVDDSLAPQVCKSIEETCADKKSHFGVLFTINVSDFAQKGNY